MLSYFVLIAPVFSLFETRGINLELYCGVILLFFHALSFSQIQIGHANPSTNLCS